MAKIPLERTIESAYRFAFTKFLSVLGVLWLPYLVVGAALAGIIYLAWPDIQSLHDVGWAMQASPNEEINFSAEHFVALMRVIGSIGRFAGLLWLLFIIARAMVTVGVLRTALGQHEGPVFVYFSLGAAVWRMIGAMLLAAIIIVLVLCLTAAACALIFFGADRFASGAAGAIKFVAVAAAFFWMVYMIFRLVFFLPPVVVAEGRIGIGRAWELGGGNVLRIIGVLIAVFLPVAIVAGIISNALFGAILWNEVRGALLSGHPLPPHAFFEALVRDLRYIWPVFVAYQLVYMTVLAGLGGGAMAAAYKSVTQTEAAA